MSVEASTWAWQQSVPSGAKLVLLALADHADQNGFCWPGADGLSKKCGLSKSSIWRHIAELEASGLLARMQRNAQAGRQNNSYQLQMESPQVSNCDTTSVSEDSRIPATSQFETLPSPNLGLPKSQDGTWVNRKEPSIESSRETSIYKGAFQNLDEIPGFTSDVQKDKSLMDWLEREKIEADHAEATAISMKATLSHNANRQGWEYRDKGGRLRTYSDLRAVFQTWVRRPRLTELRGPPNSAQPPQEPSQSRLEKIVEFKREVEGDGA